MTAKIGQSALRPDIARFARGEGNYVSDIPAPDALWIALARSSVAHAELISINVDAARRVPGVRGVFTGRDLAGTTPQSSLWDLPGQNHTHLRALAEDRLRYAGQPYAAVAAETREAAVQAAALITSDNRPLETVGSIDESLTGDTLLYPEWKSNAVAKQHWEFGDVTGALTQSHLVVAERFMSGRVHPMSLEPRSVLVRPEPDGSLTIWTSTQSIHQVRASVAECLGLPEHRLRVIAPDVGGSFGMKACAYGEETLLAFIALKLNRPVRWIETRREAFIGSTHGRDHRFDLETGFDADGRITAMRGEVILDKGADAFGVSIGTAWISGAVITSVYHVPAIDISASGLVTNKTPTGAYRGFGQPEAAFAIERTLDIAANRLGIDAAEIRRRNFVPSYALPYTTPTGLVLDSGDYTGLLDLTLSRFGYTDRTRAAKSRAMGDIRTGVGFACYSEVTNFGPSALCKAIGVANAGFDVATIRMEPSGHVRLFTSQTPMGQGIETVLAQICADELTVPVEDVAVVHGDTLSASYTGYASGGSRGAGVGGASAALVSRKLADQIRRWGALVLKADPAEVELIQGGVQVVDDPVRRCSMAAIAGEAYFPSTVPEGLEPGLEARAVFEPSSLAISYGVVAVEIEVDLALGTVRVKDVVFGHDCGVQINPKIVEGQIIGGVAQAIGASLFETIEFDDAMLPVTTSLHDYFLPLAADIPTINLVHQTTPTPFSPLGVKGVGESGVIGTPAAIANAVQHALEGSGLLLTLPLTPERVLKANDTLR